MYVSLYCWPFFPEENLDVLWSFFCRVKRIFVYNVEQPETALTYFIFGKKQNMVFVHDTTLALLFCLIALSLRLVGQFSSLYIHVLIHFSLAFSTVMTNFIVIVSYYSHLICLISLK